MTSARIDATSIIVAVSMLGLPCSVVAQDAPIATDSKTEHLVLLAADGSAVERRDSLLLKPGDHLTILHNHPHSGGLTCGDLLQLAKPGVDRIVALGANGSRYEATRGTRYDASRFEKHQCKPAHDQVTSEITGFPRNYIDGRSLEDLIEHMTSVALQTAGVLNYAASLQGRRARLSGTTTEVIRYIVRTAEQRLEREEGQISHERAPTVGVAPSVVTHAASRHSKSDDAQAPAVAFALRFFTDAERRMLPPIRIASVRPTGISPEASAWVYLAAPEREIWVAGYSETYRRADAGERAAAERLAAMIAHEVTHLECGPSEARAYAVEIFMLERLHAPFAMIRSVERARDVVLAARPAQAESQPFQRPQVRDGATTATYAWACP